VQQTEETKEMVHAAKRVLAQEAVTYYKKKLCAGSTRRKLLLSSVYIKKEHAVKKILWFDERMCKCTQFSFAWSIFCHDTHANLR
jgi:hypothetical protein